MIESRLACVALMMFSAHCWAELLVQSLDQQPFDAQTAELFQLSQGDVLLRMGGWREPDPGSDALLQPWNTLYVLGQDGRVKESVELSDGLYAFVVPYRNGFAAQRLAMTSCLPRCNFGDSPAQIVVYEHATDTHPDVLYETDGTFHTPRLVGAPDAQDLYVMEMGAQFRLTRIDAQGQIAWQKTTELIESTGFVATDDGIAFAQYAARHNPNLVLRALDRDGRQRWETPLSFRLSQEAVFSPAGFITLFTYPSSLQDRDKQRLVNVDARTGEITSDVLVEPYAYSVGTQNGLLVAGPMLGQAYVGMIGLDGEYSWLRRYVADQQVSDIQRATLTREGKLMLVTRERVTTTVTPATSVVVTDGTAASLADARGRCLDSTWKKAVVLASRLSSHGLFVEPPKAEGISNASVGCLDRETQFMTFMQALASELPAAAEQEPESRQSIGVRLTPAGKPIRMESYSADRSAYPSAGVTLSFASPYDRAAEFWKIVATQVQPHLDRMRVLDEGFVRMTGFQYAVFDRSGANHVQVLANLEQAARTVNERIATIPQEQLAEIRSTGPYGAVQILLRVDGFGPSDDAMHPLTAADRTFLDIVEKNRRAAARGEIGTRE